MLKKVLVFVFCFCSFVFAETTACNYIYLNRSPYLAGMGNIDGVFTEYMTPSGNPALLGFKHGWELEIGGGNTGMGSSLGRLSISGKIKKIGLGLNYFGYDYTFEFIDYGGAVMGDYSNNGKLLFLSAGIPVWSNISLGVSLANIEDSYEYESESKSAEVSFGGFGILWKLKNFRLGFHYVNVGDAEIWESDPLPSYGRISFGYEKPRFRIGFSAGGDQVSGYSSLGFEWWLSKWLALRGGVIGEEDVTQMTMGASIKIGNFALDFSKVVTDGLKDISYSALRYSWGVKKEEEVKFLPLEEKKEKRPAPQKPAIQEAKPVELPVQEGEKINIAVMDFEARAPLSQSEAAFISDFFRSDFVKLARFNVVEKNNMDKILAEQGFQQTGCSTAECAVQIGKILNVRIMVVGSCGQLLGQYVITMNVVDVESAKIVYSDDIQVSDPGLLRNKVSEMVKRFESSIK
ncbi:MAG: hypothetical protein J7L42_01780 [Elusimicrobia bacterium]|nr:hypothetical protein [Elusimicrobiota bacterium]